MALSTEEVSDLAELAYEAMLSGMDANEVRDDLALSEDDFKAVLVHMFDAKAEEVRSKPTEHVYVQYVIDQCKNIADLTKIIGEFRTTRQHSAMVSAIKARSDIQDKIIERGQQFGIIASSPERPGQLVAGIVIAELTNQELKQTITRELKEANRMMEQYGDRPFIDVEVGEIHRGPALPPAELSELTPAEAEPAPLTKPKRKKQRVRVGAPRRK
jgi:hypothetical protein